MLSLFLLMMRLVRVVVGVIKNQDQLLIAKRPARVVMPDYWEFPGGKVEVQETDFEALVRELNEEIGIKVSEGEFLAQFYHTFEDRRVELNVWIIKTYHGEAIGNEGQEIRWITPQEFSQYQFLPSNNFLLNYLLEAHESGMI